MRVQAGLLLLVAALVLSPAALAKVSRTDSAALLDTASLQYHAVLSYAQPNDPGNQRRPYDADSSGGNDGIETAAYEANATATRLGNATATLRWDNAPTYWVEVAATTSGFSGGQINTAFELILDGTVNLTSIAGLNHTLTITNLSAYTNYSFALSLPANWSIVSSTGVSISFQTQNSIGGSIDPTSIGVIQVAEGSPPPPPPPPINDTTPPVLNAGADRTVVAGVLTHFNGTAADNDPLFPAGAEFWWNFNYNATPFNITGQNFSFTFWTVGTYLLNFSALDRSGNAGMADVLVVVEPPDKTAPLVDAGADLTWPAGASVSARGEAADNDPLFALNARYWWTFRYNGSDQNTTGPDFSFVFWVVGTYTLTFTAMDAWGNMASDALQLTVERPDKVAPTVNAGPDLTRPAGVAVVVHGTAADNDPLFSTNARAWWTFPYNGTSRNSSGADFAFTFWVVGTYSLVLSYMDAWGNVASDVVRLTVERPDQVAPTLILNSTATWKAGIPVAFNGSVSDNDPAFPVGAQFWWTLSYNGTPWNLSGVSASFTFWVLGLYEITWTAVDAWGNRNVSTLQLTVVSPDAQPPLADAGTIPDSTAGATVAFHGFAHDDDPAFDLAGRSWWTFEYDGQLHNLSGKDAAFRFDIPGTYQVTFWAIDPWGNIGNDTREITILAAAPGSNGAQPAQGPEAFLLPLSLVVLAASALVGVVAYRRRGAGAAAVAVAPPAPPAPAAAAPRASYVLEGLLVLYKDGRLIHNMVRGAERKLESPELLGSMFAAVAEFVRDFLGEAGALSRLTYGQNTIILDRSTHLFAAAIAYGEPDDAFREQLKETLRRLESAYAGVVEEWNGERHAFEGIDAMVAPLFEPTQSLTRADVREAVADKSVKLLSGTEHYKGYVRLKVAVVNHTNESIADAAVAIEFNRAVLHLARVEPPSLEREGARVKLGTVAPGERVGAVYYLDPQACNQTNIEGSATYRDAEGHEHTVTMKVRRAEIVCPIFFTPEHANAATLRRLVESSLSSRNSKAYTIPSAPNRITYKALFRYSNEIVTRYDVKLIRSVSAPTPFSGRSWFYGMTKVSKEPVVIRVLVSEERRTVEFLVAAQVDAAVTGLLAEIHRSFMEMLKTRLPRLQVEPVLDDRLKGVLSPDELTPAEGETGPII